MFRKEVALIAITVAFWGYNLLHHAVRIDTVLEKKRGEGCRNDLLHWLYCLESVSMSIINTIWKEHNHGLNLL